MKKQRMIEALLSLSIVAVIAVPIALRTGSGHHRAAPESPVRQDQGNMDVAWSPISLKKAQAIRDFKLAQS
jgi:hypothetical protein